MLARNWSGWTTARAGIVFAATDNANFYKFQIRGTYTLIRIGQLARDNSGSIGDLLAEYDFNGRGRFVRRVHDEATGQYGNDTRNDLWHGTSGTYAGLDRFGRIVDYKYTDFSGTPTDFDRRQYTYDRNSNRLSIEHALYKAASHSATYDNLDRLTDFKTGILDSSDVVQLSDVAEGLNMDILGNFTSGAGGIKLNGNNTTISHAVNETNEITTLGYDNPAGAHGIIRDPFTTTLSDIWTADKGTWSISSGQVNVDTLTGGKALMSASPTHLGTAFYSVQFTCPTGSSTAKVGVTLFGVDASNYYMVIANRQSGKLALHKVTGGTPGGVLASANLTVADNTQYTMKINCTSANVTAWVVGQNSFSYDSSTDFGVGQTGLYSNTVNVKFDTFKILDATARPSLTPGIVGMADASIVSGELLVQGSSRGGEAIIDTFKGDDAYMVQADVKLNSGTDADIWVRYTDSNNGYRIRLDGTNIALHSVQNGKYTSVASVAYTTAASVAVKIKVNGTSIKAWVDGTLKINTTDSTHSAGGVALGGDQPKFDNLKIGYDNNADDDIDDAGDDLVVNEDFGSTDVTVAHDDAGNLIDDGIYGYTYDAWHRLVKVQASADSGAVTIQTAEFDARGRRIKKVVTNSGNLDATTVYLYNGQQIIETRDGSSNVVAQFIHGTQYIDELVMGRITGKGDFYYHQDANWNVIALTDLGGSVLERYEYTAYGEMTVHQVTSFGDRDGDQDVDSADKGTVGVDCTGVVSGACRILDLDFDGDYDATDATAFDALAQGLARHPGRTLTGVDQPFGHQGLLHDAEVGSYQSRARQYDPTTLRFMQRDPLGHRNRAASGYQDGLNLYGYLSGNPIVRLDPLGLSPCTDGCDPGAGNSAFCGCIFNCRIVGPLAGIAGCLSLGSIGMAEALCISGCAVGCARAGPFAPLCFVGCMLGCNLGSGAIGAYSLYRCILIHAAEMESARDAYCDCVDDPANDPGIASAGITCKPKLTPPKPPPKKKKKKRRPPYVRPPWPPLTCN